MIYIVINAFSIITATLASLAFGIAYCLILNRTNGTPSSFRSGKLVKLLALAFIAEAWFASILAGALILAPPEADVWTMAIGSAVVIWVGFIVPVVLVTHRYRALMTRAALADCGHWLGVAVIQALVLQASGLQMPPA
jgi:hypothetical protein